MGGTTADAQRDACDLAFSLTNQKLSEFGPFAFQSISIKPFRVERDGYLFALEYEKSDDGEWALLWPNDIMFHPSSDGKYST